MPDEHTIYLNGIDATTGQYLQPPLGLSEAARVIKGETIDKREKSWLKQIWHKLQQAHLGLSLGIDPSDPRQAGWAIVFTQDEEAAVRAALEPLIAHRRTGIGDGLVKTLEVRAGETKDTWLARHGIGAGNVQPAKVPFYLLLIGSPEKIPFTFYHHLGVEYAVGWLHFDTPGEYAAYAEAIVAYEESTAVRTSKEAVFFGARHSFDQATQLSADQLVQPLIRGDGVGSSVGVAERWGFRSRNCVAAAATKAALREVLAPTAEVRPPALLFSATHGIGFPAGHPAQTAAQGALICQDWPGFGAIGPEHYFAAADLPAATRLDGLVTFHFACYGAGTPQHDRFVHEPGATPPTIAPAPFLAALPRALLNRGALACIGHVERAWGYSIITPNAGAQLLPFENALGRIMLGQPIGSALKDFYQRYAALSVSLVSMLEEIGNGKNVADYELAAAWIGRNDSEGYLLLGDPAVRLRVAEMA